MSAKRESQTAIRMLCMMTLAALPFTTVLMLATPEERPSEAFVRFEENDALGKDLWKKHCQMCHGDDGKAETPAGRMTKTPDMTKLPWKFGTSQAEVEKIVREGAGKMPGYEKKMSGEEITAVSLYTRVLCGVVEEEE